MIEYVADKLHYNLYSPASVGLEIAVVAKNQERSVELTMANTIRRIGARLLPLALVFGIRLATEFAQARRPRNRHTRIMERKNTTDELKNLTG